MQHEKLRYQPNKLSQLLVMGGMVFMVFALFKVINVYRFTTLTKTAIILPNIYVGIEILVAIFVMLTSFLLGEKFKSYDKKWLPVGLVLTIYSVVKIFIYPIKLYKEIVEINEFLISSNLEHEIIYNPQRWFIIVVVSLIVSSILYFIGTLISYKKTNQLEQYYKEAGLEHGE